MPIKVLPNVIPAAIAMARMIKRTARPTTSAAGALRQRDVGGSYTQRKPLLENEARGSLRPRYHRP